MSNIPTEKNGKKLSKEAAGNLSKLQEKLRELFQLDRGDLDFGLYRIMALKSAEVDEFLKNDLLPQVTEALGDIADSDYSKFQEELDQLRTTLRKAGVKDIEDAERVKELNAQIAVAKKDRQTEADTYNHLYNFFSRYYDEGDFMSQRRYKGAGREAYSIPYNGEEVKLHWANADQYYIKTTENYASYIFTVGDGNHKRRMRFEIAGADNEKDNIKEANGRQRFFVLSKNFIAGENDDLVIRFDHRPLTAGEKTKHPQNGVKRQASINEEAEKRILTQAEKRNGNWHHLLVAPCPVKGEPETDSVRTVLGKHITAYTAKNSFDYFIHKDLGGFLRRELDTYLKSEVLSIDNLALADDPAVFIRGLQQIKAIKLVGSKIIDFLAQLEDFQKQLWLKKKFVLETRYCVTLDKVPESLYATIAKNRKQVDEWIKLFAIDELKGDLVQTAYSKPLKPAFLKENPYLVLDTRHFDGKFTDKLLAALSEAGPIEEQMNGLLVHGENFQALNLMQERYRGQVQCVYIDPPYNTDAATIIYKNGYRDSSWFSLLANRLLYGKRLMTKSGVQIVAIDDTEFAPLSMITKDIFIDFEQSVVVVNHHPGGAGLEGANISTTHEYAIFMTPRHQKVLYGQNKASGFSEIAFTRGGTADANLRSGRPNSFYAVLVDPSTSSVVGIEPPPSGKSFPTEDTEEGFKRIYPISGGVERVWRRSYESCVKEIKHGNLIARNSKTLYLRTPNAGKHFPIFSNWTNTKYNAGSHGTGVLKNLMGENVFNYPKSIFTVSDCVNSVTVISKSGNVLDYFAGSGTTGHAVINLNRGDGGDRKYILVEIGDHFENVLLPRIKKVTYSKDWKDGKPRDREGISQLFKYIRLESYEDTLDSLTVTSRRDLVSAAEHKEFIEDYQLRYALGEETAESASLVGKDFLDPFNYTLSIVRDGVRRDVKVDLAETFNFLLGLRVADRRQLDGVLAVTGTTAKGDNCLVLWRNMEKMNFTKLNKWFDKYRKTFGNDLNLIYVNGDHTLNSRRKSGDKWEAVTTEPVFRELMFGG